MAVTNRFRDTRGRQLPAAVFARGCYGKRQYPSRKQARGAIRSLRRQGKLAEPVDIVGAYKCKGCRAWHIGHDRHLLRVRNHGRTSQSNPERAALHPAECPWPGGRPEGAAQPDQGGTAGPGATALQYELRPADVPSGGTDPLPTLLSPNDRAGAGAPGLKGPCCT